MSEKNIDSFCIEPNEKYLYAANKVGEILTIDIDSFNIVSRAQIHNGSVNAISVHKKFNYLTALGNDGYLSISKFSGKEIKLLHMVKIREIKPEFDFFKKGPSTSQAVTFHPEKLRIASRGGSAGIFELEFNDNHYEVLHCIRAHDNHDPFTVCYIGDGDKLISGSNSGGGTTLSENGNILNKWYHLNAIHWYEPIGDGVFLAASDAMKVLRMNFYNDKENFDGPLISVDHLEHVTYNKKTRKAYTSAFDRNILEINPETCEKVRLVWKAPFKCRWIKTIERDSNIIIVQCRNGALYKINIQEGNVLAVIKETPPAQWTAVICNNKIIAAGEDSFCHVYIPSEVNHKFLKTNYSSEKKNITTDVYTYTKRIATRNSHVVFGRTSGEIIVQFDDGSIKTCMLASSVRDLDFYDNEQIYVVCENGCLYRINILNMEAKKVYQSDSPLWALAVNEEKGLIAFANRIDRLYCFDVNANNVKKWIVNFSFVKRMKWKDSETLWFTGGSVLFEAKLNSNKKKVVCAFQNTIEDFAWDIHRRYLVILSYTRFLYLCDFETGEVLHQAGDKADYGKGILFLDRTVNPSGYQADFISFGRAGTPSYNRIHDDRIISYGFINKLESRHD